MQTLQSSADHAGKQNEDNDRTSFKSEYSDLASKSQIMPTSVTDLKQNVVSGPKSTLEHAVSHWYTIS